jgi:predicted nucleic acid-binding protein
MKVLFDTSVLVAAVVADLKNDETALECLLSYSQEPHQGFSTTHALAECYATLTAFPLKRRIQPSEAGILVR